MYIVLCCPACCPTVTLSYAVRRVICGILCCPVLSYDAVLCCPVCTLVVCSSCPALPLQLRPSIACDTRGDALTQLLNISLTLEYVTGCYETHKTYPLLRHFPSLFEAVQVNPMPQCYLSRLLEAGYVNRWLGASWWQHPGRTVRHTLY